MKADEIVGKNMQCVDELVDQSVLYDREKKTSGYLSVNEKLSLGIPPGLEVHNNHTCSRASLKDEFGDKYFLYWTRTRWCVVKQSRTEDTIPLERGVESAGKWTA